MDYVKTRYELPFGLSMYASNELESYADILFHLIASTSIVFTVFNILSNKQLTIIIV
jgi:hypothetical protein